MAATTVPENLTKRHAGRPSGPAAVRPPAA